MSTVKWVESPERESAMWETLCKRKGQVTEQLRQIAWIKRIAESSNALWKKIPNQALNQYGGLEFLIECDYDPNLLNLENLPEFYHTILNYWHDFRTLTCDKQILIKKTNNLEQP